MKVDATKEFLNIGWSEGAYLFTATVKVSEMWSFKTYHSRFDGRIDQQVSEMKNRFALPAELKAGDIDV